MDEAELAKEYWGTTDKQGKSYRGKLPPMYATSVARVIKSLNPTSVLEFGCNAGRNLELIRSKVSSQTKLKGIDINKDSIESGKEMRGLDLECVDETYFSNIEPNSYDVIFTVSVLDHIPEIRTVVKDLYNACSNYVLSVEPHIDSNDNYLKTFKDENRIPDQITTETPYSYTHDYKNIFSEAGFETVLDLPLPTYFGNLGLLYRLTLYKKNTDTNISSTYVYDKLQDEIIFEIMLRLLRPNA